MSNTCANCDRLKIELNRILDRHEHLVPAAPDDSNIRQFLSENTIPRGEVHVGLLYNRYLRWCLTSADIPPQGKNSFGMALSRLGFEVRRGTAGARYRTGLSLT